MKVHNLGFPRIGSKRQLKFNLENYWAGHIDKTAFLLACQQQRQANWQLQLEAGIECLPVGDFAHYDHVLTTSLLLGVVPNRFVGDGDRLDLEFRIARGKAPSGASCAASDMTKWFDTNYHYIVPELHADTTLTVDISGLLAQIQEAKAISTDVKPVLLGPLSYLYLSAGEIDTKLVHLAKLISAYQQIFDQLEQADIEWLQLDEPILGLELPLAWLDAFQQGYQQFNKGRLKLLLTTYFSSVDAVLDTITNLNVDGLHIDTVAEPTDCLAIVNQLPDNWLVSLGVIDGRNIWKADLVSIYQQIQPIYAILGERLWLAPSCSLLHAPVDLEQEQALDSEIKSWLAFAKQKCTELALLKAALIEQSCAVIRQYSAPVNLRTTSVKCQNRFVQAAIDNLQQQSFHRQQHFTQRKQAQQRELNLPLYPTTTIGSFPQTGNIRQQRALLRQKKISQSQYTDFIKQQIKTTIEKQQALGLDVLVHGEAERNDMVEYFGEQFNGVAISEFAWVQSYGSRCVKPPIIYGDVSRKNTITADWINYAQSLTNKPVKAMLTGPITLLSWSFVRNDIARQQVAQQLALAISEEVADLEQSGSKIIQIDEPAIREAMPLKRSAWPEYFHWATAAFRLTAANVKETTQIHSHMCYSDFNEILPAIIDLDCDVLTIETSRSNMALLKAFEQLDYPNDLGPGVYDIHSPNVPSVEWITQLIRKAGEYLPKERLWINPDCGLKTRSWLETEQALGNMVTAAKQLRL